MRRHNSRLLGGCRIGERFGVHRYLMQPITPCPNMKQISKYHDVSFSFTVGTNAVWFAIANRYGDSSGGAPPEITVDKGLLTRVGGNYTTQMGGSYLEHYTIIGLVPGDNVTVTLGPKRAGTFIEGMTLVTAIGIQGSGTDFQSWATVRSSYLTAGTVGMSPAPDASSMTRKAISLALLTTTNRGGIVVSGSGGATVDHTICDGGTHDTHPEYPDAGGVYALTTFNIEPFKTGSLRHMWNSGQGQGRDYGSYAVAVYVLKEGYSFTLAIPMLENT